ncbi:MAG: Rv3654c family TadE-like protein, partial [Mycobacterium sp.]
MRCCPGSRCQRRRYRRSNPPGDDAGECGAASVLAAVFIAIVLAVTFAGVSVGSVVVARHRAQAAADLAALAAAGRLPAGPEQACASAGDVARAMKAGVARCDVEELDV